MKSFVFNMIEVSLAMLVISIGVVSIFGLIPIGYKAHRDAIYQNYSADVAEEVLHRLSQELQEDWGVALGRIPVDAPPNISGINQNSTWTPVDGYLSFTTSGSDRIYRFHSNTDLPSGRNVTDFDGIIRVWRTPSEGFEYDDATAAFVSKTDSAYTKRAILHAEVCWPITNAYTLRSRSFYSMEATKGQ